MTITKFKVERTLNELKVDQNSLTIQNALKTLSARKVSVFGVFLVHIFGHLDWIRTLRIRTLFAQCLLVRKKYSITTYSFYQQTCKFLHETEILANRYQLPNIITYQKECRHQKPWLQAKFHLDCVEDWNLISRRQQVS